MRTESTALIARYYEAFNRADAEAMLGLLTEDVVHDINEGPREVGRDAFRAFMRRMARSYRETLEDIVIMATDDGARASAEYVVRGMYLATDEGLPEARGQTYVLPGGAFFEVRDGGIARVTNYYALSAWLDQVK
jgi:steroid delta-isomerase-like uncharacterized protein